MDWNLWTQHIPSEMLHLQWLWGEYKIWSHFVLLSHDAINSHPSKRCIANLIQCGVTTSVTLTYNTTNTSNEGNVMWNEAVETFFFLQFHCTHNYLLFCTDIIQMLKLFQSQCLFVYIILPYFIIKIYYEVHIIYMHDFRHKVFDNCLNIALSIQFYLTINIPMSYPLKFMCHGCCQNNQKKIVVQEKSWLI